MVRPGEFLERSVVVKSGRLSLDALYHRGTFAPPTLLASPHPALGGSMTAPVISELAWALTRVGHATMRFDYRGVGASQGESRHPAGELRRIAAADLGEEIDDLLAVGQQLLSTTARGTYCAVGYSFGAAVVLGAAADPRIERLVLVAPPTSISDFGQVRAVEKPLLIVAAQNDAMADRAALQSLLPSHARLEVVPHADHFFLRGLTELGKLVAAWIHGDQPLPVGAEGPGTSEVREIELDPGDGEALELDVGDT